MRITKTNSVLVDQPSKKEKQILNYINNHLNTYCKFCHIISYKKDGKTFYS